MRTRLLVLPAIALLLGACAASQPAPKQAMVKTMMYTHQEGSDPNDHTKHTVSITGEGPTGSAYYAARYFGPTRSQSLFSSKYFGETGSGTYTLKGTELTVSAGGLKGTGTIKYGEWIELNGKRFSYSNSYELPPHLLPK